MCYCECARVNARDNAHVCMQPWRCVRAIVRCLGVVLLVKVACACARGAWCVMSEDATYWGQVKRPNKTPKSTHAQDECWLGPAEFCVPQSHWKFRLMKTYNRQSAHALTGAVRGS